MKKVLIVEDDESWRDSLQYAVGETGFELYIASSAPEARHLAELHWEELDVALLDMELDDVENPRTNEPLTTGADIAIEFRKKKRSFPPETLVYSARSEVKFYRLALRLGAAAYLGKGEDDVFVVAQHVRVLALRRALNGENPKIIPEVAQIAIQSSSKAEAILNFCRRVMKQEFEACLGAPFVILFTNGETTMNCADTAGLPTGSDPFYHTLQAYAHGKGNLTEPFVLEVNELETPQERETALAYKLNHAAFLPISLSSNLRLSIGILHQENRRGVAGETYAKSLCMVLAQYLRPTVLENVMTIWSQWTELRATRTSTAKLCLSLGQEIDEGLESAELELLENLADDLNNTGQLLIQLERQNRFDEIDAVSVNQIIDTTWRMLAPSREKSELRLEVQGDCVVQAQRNDLEIIFSRLLQWFIYRSQVMPLGAECIVKVHCEAHDEAVSITFEDYSERLPQKLREDMFAPFTQAISTPFDEVKSTVPRESATGAPIAKNNPGRYLPLYLAKMLVEGRYHGLLEDHSDEITERSYGHRILVQFPAANNLE